VRLGKTYNLLTRWRSGARDLGTDEYCSRRGWKSVPEFTPTVLYQPEQERQH